MLQLRGFDGEFTPQSGDRPVLMLAGGIGALFDPLLAHEAVAGCHAAPLLGRCSLRGET